jgi:ketosteroid isomerase-like protein
MTSSTQTLKNELLQQERAYLAAVENKNGAAAAKLTARESLVVSGRGPMRVDAAAIERMVEQHDANSRYEIDETSIEIVNATDDVAIIAYKLRTMPADGPATEAFDTDVWVRRGGEWACALHTEIPAA